MLQARHLVTRFQRTGEGVGHLDRVGLRLHSACRGFFQVSVTTESWAANLGRDKDNMETDVFYLGKNGEVGIWN
jgi:hypothetical protein